MTLTEIQKNFTAWRENRNYPNEKIPDELWQQVAMVFSSYSPSVLSLKLGLSRQQLKKAMLGDGFASFLLTPTTASPRVMNEPQVCELSLERLGTRLMAKVTMSAFDVVLSKLAESTFGFVD